MSLARPRLTREALLQGLQSLGIAPGDVVYVASSMMALGQLQNPVEDTLWALRECVGPEGTLVMPAFNFSFCRGEAFDVAETPSDCGVLTEAFRRLPDARRSSSPPFHSVTAIGPLAEEICGRESITSFGSDSVFQYLVDIDAKHLLIGCGYHEGVAHFHWLEERHEVPYRYWKKFEGDLYAYGKATRRAYFMFVRRLEERATLNADPLGMAFEQTGLVSTHQVGLSRLRAFRLRDFAAFGDPIFRDNPHAILETPPAPETLAAKSPILRLDHIAIVSRYSKKIRRLMGHLGYRLTYEGIVPQIGVNCQYYEGPLSGVEIEFVDPIREGSRVDNHFQRHSDSPLHHLAFEVTSLEEGLRFFESRGYVPLDGNIYLGPKPYQRVIFLSPLQTGGLLVELVASDGQTHEAYGGK